MMGAKVGANVHRHGATSGHVQRASSQVSPILSDREPHPASGWR
jgi:hypothetical protein